MQIREKKTELVVMVKYDDWKRIVSKQQIAILLRNRPFIKDFQCPFNVYFYVPKKKLVCGFGEIEKIIPTYISEELEKDTGVLYEEQKKMYNGEKLYCWFLKNVKVYEEAKTIGKFGLKCAPRDFKYIYSANNELRRK